MKLDTLIAKLRLGLLDPAKLPEIAADALGSGHDSPAMRQLAGADGQQSEELRNLFEKSLAELGVPVPTQDEAGLLVARSIAEEVLSGSLSPYEGAKQIWGRIYVRNPHLHALKTFVGLASEYEDDPKNRNAYQEDIIKECRLLVTTKAPVKELPYGGGLR